MSTKVNQPKIERSYLIVLFALFVIVVAVHLIDVFNEFVLADTFSIQTFRSLNQADWPGFWSNLFTQGMLQPFSEPITKASIAIDYQSGRLNPVPYHLTNVVLHAVNCVLAFVLMYRLPGPKVSKKNIWILPAMASLIFGLHPIVADSVAYVSNRDGIVCTTIIIVALNLFLLAFRGQALNKVIFAYLATYILVLFAIGAAPMGLGLAFGLIFCGLMSKPEEEPAKDFIEDKVYELGAPMFVGLLGALLFLMPKAHPIAIALGTPMPGLAASIASQFKCLITYYLPAIIWPLMLSISPDPSLIHAQAMSDPMAMLGALTCVLFIVASLMVAPRAMTKEGQSALAYKMVCLGLGFVAIFYLPECFLRQAETANSARFYLPSLGLAMVLAGCLGLKPGLANLTDKSKKSRVIFAVCLVSLILSAFTIHRSLAFQNNVSLFKVPLDSRPDDFSTRALYSFSLLQKGGDSTVQAAGEADRAQKDYERAFGANVCTLASLPCADITRAYDARLLKRPEESRFLFERAYKGAESQRLAPQVISYARAGYVLAASDSNHFGQAGQAQEIRRLAEQALEDYPANARLYLALGKAYMATGAPDAWEMACKQFDRGRHFDPNDADFVAPAVEAALNTGYPIRFEQAHGGARLLKKVQPGPVATLLMARACLETGRIAQGQSEMNEYFAGGAPAIPPALVIASGLARQDGRQAEAKQLLDRALKMDPNALKNTRLFMLVKPKEKLGIK